MIWSCRVSKIFAQKRSHGMEPSCLSHGNDLNWVFLRLIRSWLHGIYVTQENGSFFLSILRKKDKFCFDRTWSCVVRFFRVCHKIGTFPWRKSRKIVFQLTTVSCSQWFISDKKRLFSLGSKTTFFEPNLVHRKSIFVRFPEVCQWKLDLIDDSQARAINSKNNHYRIRMLNALAVLSKNVNNFHLIDCRRASFAVGKKNLAGSALLIEYTDSPGTETKHVSK